MEQPNVASLQLADKSARFLANRRQSATDTRTNQRWVRCSVGALLGILAGLLALGSALQSPTLNEPGHLVAGICNWQFGRFDVYKVDPPLVQMVAALPAAIGGERVNWDGLYESPGARPELPIGEKFIAEHGLRSFWLITFGRWMCLPIVVYGGYVCFRWAQCLYGSAAGVLALSLWCFCPNILGHGQLIAPDVPAASLGLAAAYAFWRWLRSPSWTRALIGGLALGVAELAKTTLVIFFPLWPFIWLIYRWPAKRQVSWRTSLRELSMLGVGMVIAVYLINLGYGFEGTMTKLGDFKFISTVLGEQNDGENASPWGNRFAHGWLQNLPIPLPKNYVLGIDLQKSDFENYANPSYLNGEFRNKGWWNYYLYALAIKVPLGIWVLMGLAATRRFWTRGDNASFAARALVPGAESPQPAGGLYNQGANSMDEFALLCPPAAIVILVSSQTGFSEHMRYVIPAFPFLFVWIGRIVPRLGWRHCRVTALAAGALAWFLGSSFWAYPHCLSYFNELVGGPVGGPAHLIHSNVDWGQDLFFLKRWLDEHREAVPIKLAYFGSFDPAYAGIQYVAPDVEQSMQGGERADPKIAPGWYAISVNFVRGFPYQLYYGRSKQSPLTRNALIAFQKLTPVAMAGYSIYIYHVPEIQSSESKPPPSSRSSNYLLELDDALWLAPRTFIAR